MKTATEITLSESSTAYLAASVALFYICFTALFNLIDHLALNIVDMTYTLQWLPELDLASADTYLQTTLLFNFVANLQHVSTPIDSMETLQQNLNAVHFMIVHGSDIKFYLFTINPDLTLNLLAEGCVNQYSIDFDKSIINTQFQAALDSIIFERGEIKLKLTIIVASVGNFLVQVVPYMPLQGYMLSHDFSLFACVYGNIDYWFYLNTVSDNLAKLLGFREFLVNECTHLFNMSLDIPSDALAENGWFIIKASNQLIRYLEAIHNIYTNIEAVDTVVSQIMEED